jgi:hypothetical protein
MHEQGTCRSYSDDIAKSTDAVAVFPDVQSVRAAIDDLSMHGFDPAAIRVLASSVACGGLLA